MRAELSRLQTERSYYEIQNQQNHQLMLYAHDAKNHLAAIQALNQDPRIDHYLALLSQQLKDYTRSCHIGNQLLDVMIHKYIITCELRNIRFEYDIRSCNLSQLADIDLVAILGNLMDNAVAAAEQSEEKYISLSTSHRNSYSVIDLTNSCDAPPVQRGDRLLSTKTTNRPERLLFLGGNTCFFSAYMLCYSRRKAYMKRMEFRKELYSKIALIKAAYNFTDSAYVHLDADAQYYYVTMEEKPGCPEISKPEFENEMLTQSIRHEVYQQTKNIRALLYARSMASSIIVEDALLDEAADEGDYKEDEILKDWFEAHERDHG